MAGNNRILVDSFTNLFYIWVNDKSDYDVITCWLGEKMNPGMLLTFTNKCSNRFKAHYMYKAVIDSKHSMTDTKYI